MLVCTMIFSGTWLVCWGDEEYLFGNLRDDKWGWRNDRANVGIKQFFLLPFRAGLVFQSKYYSSSEHKTTDFFVVNSYFCIPFKIKKLARRIGIAKNPTEDLYQRNQNLEIWACSGNWRKLHKSISTIDLWLVMRLWKSRSRKGNK